MECSPCCGSNAVCLTKSFAPLANVHKYEPSCAPFDGISSYRSAFTGCYVPPSRSMKPDTSRSYDPSCAPFDGISTYRAAFLPFSVCPPVQPLSKKIEYNNFSCAPFDGISTYRGDFRGCIVPRVSSLKPSTFYDRSYDPSCAPMDGMTTHRSSFIPYCLKDCMYAKQRSAKPAAVSGEVSCAPFDGMTTYRCDFFPHCPNRRETMKPDPSRPSFSDAPFADLSTYRTDFAPFHFINCDGDVLRGNGADASYCHDPCPPSNDCQSYSANIGAMTECCGGGSCNIQCAGEGGGVRG